MTRTQDRIVPVLAIVMGMIVTVTTAVLGQLHLYLHDILPQVFTWTPVHGVLGPTQPR